MKLLEKYIRKSVLSAILLVTFVLAGLQVFILFIQQMKELGQGNYGIDDVAIYVLLQMPYQVYLFFPIASLLGGLIGLGVLANHRELVVMRASGMSILQISVAVLKAAFMLILIVTILGETIVPKMAYYANNRKAQALSGGQSLRTAKGVWLRDHNDYIFIGQNNSKNVMQQVVQFRFGPEHQLMLARKIDTVLFEEGQWQAVGVQETDFEQQKTTQREIKKMPWDVVVKPSLLTLNNIEPDEMTLYELHQYLQDKRRNHLTAVNYQLAYFQRLLQPLATLVMMLLAIPCIFGPLRSSSMGSKFLMGAVVGFSFYILNRFFGLAGQVFQLSPLLVAPLPILMFALLGLYLMKRVR